MHFKGELAQDNQAEQKIAVNLPHLQKKHEKMNIMIAQLEKKIFKASQ